MAGSLAKAFSSIGAYFIVVAPLLGFIGVALSGSNTSTNAMFGKFQALVGQLLGMPPMLLPTLNSVGAEIGKPIAPQTASVGPPASSSATKAKSFVTISAGRWSCWLISF
jgi:lactate permease